VGDTNEERDLGSSDRKIDSVKKRLNVDSPSFTPVLLDSSGSSFGSKAALGLSPKAAVAAPFTPRSSKAGTVHNPSVAPGIYKIS